MIQIKQNNRVCCNNIGASLTILITVIAQGSKLAIFSGKEKIKCNDTSLKMEGIEAVYQQDNYYAYCHLQQKFFSLFFMRIHSDHGNP